MSAQFEKGDRVEIIGSADEGFGSGFPVGGAGTVHTLHLFPDDGMVYVRLDGEDAMHAWFPPANLRKVDAPEPEDTDDACPCSKGSNHGADDSERYYLTCDGISGLPCKAHGTNCRGRRAEDADDVEPEPLTEPSVDNSDDLTEPEPLKEGDWCLAWVQVDNPRANDDGNIMVAIPRVNRFWLMANIQPDAIVRSAEAQVPPWIEAERAEDEEAISAIRTALVVEGGMHDDRYTQQTAESLYRAGIRHTKAGAS